MHRLRVATVEQIGEVLGFGGKAAAELKAFLPREQSELLPPQTGLTMKSPPLSGLFLLLTDFAVYTSSRTDPTSSLASEPRLSW